MRSDILYRVREVIRATTGERRRLKELEEETGIPDRNWKQVWSGRQRPTAHMIEALARRWPQYAFWLTTGLTDAANGHTAPPDAWTCNEDRASTEAERAAIRYFEFRTLLQDAVYGMAGLAEQSGSETPTSLGESGPLHADANVPKAAKTETISDAKVFVKKQSDLDHAIARIAYDRRLKTLRTQFPAVDANDGYVAAAHELLDTLYERREAAKQRAQ